MTRYINITDQQEAFEYIDHQEWTAQYKSIARYRWKLRHTPENIRRRTRKECPICYENCLLSDFNHQSIPCCHSSLVCSTCLKKLDSCPFCRTQWKPKQQNMIIFRVPVSLLNDVFSRNDREILETVAEILHHISPEQN